MGKVFFDPGIESVSGILMGTDPYYLRRYPARDGGVMHKMLLATHRTAATTSNKCNRIYLRTPVKRTSPLTQREHQIRNRFMKITTDQQTFIAQKNEPNGAKTMKQWYWRVCGAEWDQAHA